MIDKTPKDKNRCRNVLLSVKHTVEDEAAGDHRFEIMQITSNEKKQKVKNLCSILKSFSIMDIVCPHVKHNTS